MRRWAFVIASLLLGCGASHDALLRRAEVELSCPADALRARTLVDALGTGKTVRVEGCGRGRTYTQMCDGSEGELIRSCTWTR